MERSVKEKSWAEIDAKLKTFNSDLIKLEYLEAVLRTDVITDVKRSAIKILVAIYEKNLMYDRAAKALSEKAVIDISVRDKIESYTKAGEYYARSGNIESSDNMFIKAARDASVDQQKAIKEKMKQIFLNAAKDFEKKSKRNIATKFYERMLKMNNLNEIEKKEVKDKLMSIYKSFGKFAEMKTLEHM
ncbi:MAG: hypothetical protein Q7S33_01905 [Nanoarchaeota archaeon]|nr:hypothetical protein [Nanoarchaeota archaeon]